MINTENKIEIPKDIIDVKVEVLNRYNSEVVDNDSSKKASMKKRM